jgi:hypothetical protein
VNLKKRDVTVISVGANDVYRNNPNEALMQIIKFIQNYGNTNIMILDNAHRHGLVEYSCVNRAMQVFNHKFTKHGMHFNRREFGIYHQQNRCLQLGWNGKLCRKVLGILMNFIVIELLYHVRCVMTGLYISSCLCIYVLSHVLHPVTSFSQKGSME